MSSFQRFITRTPILIMLFILMMMNGLSFIYTANAIGGEGNMLDMAMSGNDALTRLAAMTDEQKSAHFLGTAILDTTYPIFYGFFLIGMIWRFAPFAKYLLALPAYLVIPIDLIENTTQMFALTGNTDYIGAKDILTPLKFGCFQTAAVIMLLCLVWAGVSHLLKGRA